MVRTGPDSRRLPQVDRGSRRVSDSCQRLVQVTAGTVLLPVTLAVKPMLVVAPAPSPPFHPASRTETVAPVWVSVPPQSELIVWPLANVQPSVQPAIGAVPAFPRHLTLEATRPRTGHLVRRRAATGRRRGRRRRRGGRRRGGRRGRRRRRGWRRGGGRRRGRVGGRRRRGGGAAEPVGDQDTYITTVLAGPYFKAEDAWRGTLARRHPFLDIPLALYCRASMAASFDTDALFRLTRNGLSFFNELFRFPLPVGQIRAGVSSPSTTSAPWKTRAW